MMGWILLGWLASPGAWATTISDKTDMAREAILDGDFEKAHDLLDEAEELVPKSPEPVLRDTLSRIPYFRGILEYYVGDREVQALEYFKAALVHNEEFRWDVELVTEEEPQDLFELLRNEIGSRPRPSAGIPVAAITEKIYIDGMLMNSYDDVVEGRHLVQVLCADGNLKSRWVEFGDAPDYGCVCSLSECFRPSLQGDETETRASSGSFDRVLLSAGGISILGGAIVNFALLNPAWQEVQNASLQPHTTTRAQADRLEEQFSRRRALTLSLLGGGILMGGTGTAMRLMDGGWVVGLSGSGAWIGAQF
ncbi:MAG: hypothetical protein VX519_12430 [Myxococcota bacterium]|nr:hypothetical protein [Myxococcota bacterium]